MAETTEITVPLDRLLFDPNDPRFAGERWKALDEATIGDTEVQREALLLIERRSKRGLSKLIDSFRTHGWLSIDEIAVRSYGGEHYIVVEGNRRVAALKILQSRYVGSGLAPGVLDPAIFDALPVVVVDEQWRASPDGGTSNTLAQLATALSAVGGPGAALAGLAIGALLTRPWRPSESTIEPAYPPPDQRYLSSVVVTNYRGVQNLSLDALRRINLLAGLNNAGKTSILEAVRLLVSQTEPAGMFDVLRRRGRLAAFDAGWVAEQLPEIAEIRGQGGEAVVVRISSSQDHALDVNRLGYLRSLVIEGRVGERAHRSTTHLFRGSEEMRTERDGKLQLGPVVHSSPFSSQDPKVLVDLYDAAVVAGLDDLVVEQLREMVDPKVEAIKLTSGPPPRFRVSRSGSPPPDNMDLAMYGDGFQRLFHIGLLFAHAQHGFVLIDELENGIHAGLLPSLARMVHAFAVRFDAQVFIATHSKECIDAFVALPEIAADVRGFSLGFDDDGQRAVEAVDGETLARLVELMNADLRSMR